MVLAQTVEVIHHPAAPRLNAAMVLFDPLGEGVRHPLPLLLLRTIENALDGLRQRRLVILDGQHMLKTIHIQQIVLSPIM